MKIATKTLVTLLIVTVMSLSMVSGVSAAPSEAEAKKSSIQRLEKIQKRHDRKLHLTASVLGMTTDQLKAELKHRTFEQILKRHGFKTYEAFNKALVGKLKDELKRRGWSERKINSFLERRMQRLAV
ncbi:MAG TPA: hypothetical protein VD907_02290 [Verrucomicrobiae bacterium]|nr:hypothetical protein [Verrucomicrobiae bacterium]